MKLPRVTLLVLLAVATVVAGAAAASGAPSQLLAASLAAANKQHSVHYRSDSVYGQVKVTIVGDAAVDRGIQRIAYSRGGSTGHISVVMIGAQVFIRGDRYALTNFLRFTPQLAAQTAGSWVAVPTTSKDYAAIAADVELHSTVSDLAMRGMLSKLAPSTRGGMRVVGIRARSASGGQTTTETLYVRAAGTPLPVAQLAKQGPNTSIVTYSRWNAKVRIAMPVPKFVLRG